MQEAIEPIMKLAGKLKPRHDDDFVDRLHYLLTPTIFTTLALLIAGKQFVGQPIQCWAPNEMAIRGAWMRYAENLCFAENTYYIAEDEAFPMQKIERERREIHYYQWVAFILMGQVLMLLAPKLIWNAFSWRSGFNVRSLIQHAQTLSANGELEGKERASKDLGERIGRGILHHQRKGMSGDPVVKGGPRLPDYPEYFHQNSPSPSAYFVTLHLLLLKLLNLCVVLVQLVLLTKFLENPADNGESTTYWGFAVLQDLWAGRNWRESGAFPRVTFCDFQIRQPTKGVPNLRYSLQCVLMINMVNEKFFLFIWFWLLFLALIGSYNLCIWLFRALNDANAEQFVRAQLRFATPIVPSQKELAMFVRRGLCVDGVTVLRLITMNCDPTVSSMLVLYLWNRYKQALFVGRMKAEMTRKLSENSTQIHWGRNRQRSDRNGDQWASQIQMPMSPPNGEMTAMEEEEGEANLMGGRRNPSPIQQQVRQPSPNDGMDQQMPPPPPPDQSNLPTSTPAAQFVEDEQQQIHQMERERNANAMNTQFHRERNRMRY